MTALSGILAQLVRVRHRIAGLKAVTADLQTVLADQGSLTVEAKAVLDRLKLAIDDADAEIPAGPEGSVDVHTEAREP